MKKYIVILAAAMAFLSCQKNAADMKGDLVDFEYIVSTSEHSKATLDNDGNAANVNRYIMEIYTADSRYIRKVNTVTAGALTTSFNFKLVKGQAYTALFWADTANGDNDNYYNTQSLKDVVQDVTKLAYKDERDAFFGSDSIAATESTFTRTVYLKRPFAQLNVITDDIAEINATEMASALTPDACVITYSAPSHFNVATAQASVPTAISYTCQPYYQTEGTDGPAAWTLSMDYILASASEADIKEIGWVVKKGTNVINDLTFSSVPLQRNFRTNVKGSLLSNIATYNVEILPAWNTPEKDKIQ